MAKDYWGSGTGSLTPRDPNEAQATPAFDASAPAPAARAPARPAARLRVPDMPRASLRQKPAVALGDAQDTAKNVSDDFGTASRFGKLSLPDRVSAITFGRKLWFGVAFLAPVALGALYLFALAPDEYVTEYRFSVRVPVGQQGSAAGGGASLSALFGGNPTPGSDLLDNYTVADYVGSAQAARDLDAKVNLKTMYNKPYDPFSKLGSTPSQERLGKYWRSMVYSNYDVATGLAEVRVKAYSAADSYAIANNLINLSSDLVNNIGTRSQQDSMRFAQSQLDRANTQVATLRGELANLRRASNMVDPTQNAMDVNDALVTQLVNRRAQVQAQLEIVSAQLHNPQAPQVELLQRQIGAINQQINQARASGGVESGKPNIAVTMGQFEEINGKLKAAQTIQAAAAQALNNAQTNAEAQRLYLTTYVRPTQPETPTGPNRWLSMLLITLVAGMVWIIGRLIGNSVMEHG